MRRHEGSFVLPNPTKNQLMEIVLKDSCLLLQGMKNSHEFPADISIPSLSPG